MSSAIRTRWAAVGAAVAVTLGAGGIGMVAATSPSDAATFVPITPCRVIDTRPDFQVGSRSTPLGADETIDVTATGNAGQCSSVPASASGVVLNVTTLDATLLTFLTIWATGQARPDASSLNPAPGQPPTPNAVTTGLSGSGEFSIYNFQGSVHVLADIVGYYTDHNHDDRYYNKGQVEGAIDDAADLAKSVSIGPNEMIPTTGASHQYSGGNGNTGVRFTDSVAGTWFTVVVPTDATVGTDLLVEVLWHVNESGCTVDMRENSISASRLGETGLLVESELISYIVRGPIEQYAVRKFAARVSIEGGFRPGDFLNYSVYRAGGGGAADTCTADVYVDGARVLYD